MKKSKIEKVETEEEIEEIPEFESMNIVDRLYEIEISQFDEGGLGLVIERMPDNRAEQKEQERLTKILQKDNFNADVLAQVSELRTYKNKDGYFVPSNQILSSLENGGKKVKIKGGNSRFSSSWGSLIRVIFKIEPNEILIEPQEYKELQNFVKINQVRVWTSRPEFKNWKLHFKMHVSNEQISEEDVRDIIQKAGLMFGIGTARKLGYGRFMLTSFKKIN